jgi:formiminotetrahydrofolate cyclodeaminase
MERDKLVGLDLMSFADEVRSDKAVPGGGSVSAYSASLAAGLVSMVAQLTMTKKELEAKRSTLEEIQSKSEAHQLTLLSLVDEDARSFTRLLEAYRLPKIEEEAKRRRTEEIQTHLKKAAEVPLTTAQHASAVIDLARQLSTDANMNAISDLQTAIYVAHASALGALANVNINLAGTKDDRYRAQMQSRVAAIQTELDRNKSEALDVIAKRSSVT